MKHTLKTGGKRMTALLLILITVVSLFSGTALAAQVDEYHDPAEHWLTALDRTNELDVNSTVTYETFYCGVCKQNTSFIVWRTPEYSRDGVTAMSRNIRLSDGTCIDGVSTGIILDGTPGVDAYYTGYHWTKSCCETCGTMNSNGSLLASEFGKNVYWLYDCAAEFMEELDEIVTYEYTDETYHTKTTEGGSYCCFCYGTHHTTNSTLERHNIKKNILPQISNGRFAIVEKCEDCSYEKISYVAAKSVVADYYGTVDGEPHTLTVSDLSEAGVSTQIRYGNSAETCTMTSAPNYTEEGQYTVYYSITYSYGGESMTEDGVAYVWLHDESSCGCGCGNENCDCKDKDCDGNCCNTSCGDNHNFVLLETIDPTCNTLGYSRYACVDCGKVEKRDYTNALDHNWQSIVIREATCEDNGKVMNICKNCGVVSVESTSKGEHMMELSGKTEEEIYQELKGVIFLNPMHGYGGSTEVKYLMADEYLSGNVREKLEWAKRSAEMYPDDYAINVEALKRVQPKDLGASEIAVRLGATWLPPEIVEQFKVGSSLVPFANKFPKNTKLYRLMTTKPGESN